VAVAVLVDPVAGDVEGARANAGVVVVAIGAAELAPDGAVAVEVVVGGAEGGRRSSAGRRT
jgi:hypothetical protein